MGEHVIDIGARVPRTDHPLLSRFALRVLGWLGWRIDIHLPDEPRLLVLGAPHTSNWDGVLAILAMLGIRLRMGIFIKHTAFKGVVGRILEKVDAIPIDRSASGGVVAQTIAAFRERGALVIGIAPEGTRQRVDKWKRGWHLIADGARVPVACAYIDYARKVVGTGPWFVPTGDYARDLATVQAFYRTITPKLRENFSATG